MVKKGGWKNYYGTISKTEYISTQTVKETDDYICVVYYAQGLNAYIGFYNKKNGESIKLKDLISQNTLIYMDLAKSKTHIIIISYSPC